METPGEALCPVETPRVRQARLRALAEMWVRRWQTWMRRELGGWQLTENRTTQLRSKPRLLSRSLVRVLARLLAPSKHLLGGLGPVLLWMPPESPNRLDWMCCCIDRQEIPWHSHRVLREWQHLRVVLGAQRCNRNRATRHRPQHANQAHLQLPSHPWMNLVAVKIVHWVQVGWLLGAAPNGREQRARGTRVRRASSLVRRAPNRVVRSHLARVPTKA